MDEKMKRNNEEEKSKSPKQKNEAAKLDNPNKYLAMEQPSVSYTKEDNHTANSDRVDPNDYNGKDEWDEEGGNSRNSDAFNEDDTILNDNLDLDEDQNKSISSDDDDFEESNERYTN